MFALAQFQFHEGPIKTIGRLKWLKSKTKFQFHEGPIKTRIRPLHLRTY